MAVNFDLQMSGPEVQDRLDQVVDTQADLQNEVQNRIDADAIVAVECKQYADAATEAERERAMQAEANRYTKEETYSKEQLNSLITTPEQGYVTVTAKDSTTDVTDLLPEEGSPDTIYRVAKWDGGQYNENVYCEYAWDGSQYIPLETKQVGIDAVPTIGSNNLVESGGVADALLTKLDKSLDGDTFYLADKDGNVIMKIDAEGVKSVDFLIGKNKESIKNGISNLELDKLNRILQDNKFYFIDNDGYIICKIDGRGLHCVDFLIGEDGVSVKDSLNTHPKDLLYGKTLCCCGDSITYGADMDSAGITDRSDIEVWQSNASGVFSKVTNGFLKSYGYLIAERHNMKFYNAGVSGSTMQGIVDKNGFSLANGRYTKLPDHIDILTLFFGWNDTAYGTLGTINDNTNDSYYGAYNVVMPYLFNKYPYTRIVLIVPFGTDEGHRNAIRELSNRWGVRCFDMYQGGTPLYYGKESSVGVLQSVVTQNRAKYQVNGGAHPNSEGHKEISRLLEPYLY